MPTWLSPHGPSQDLIETESKKGTARLRWWQELNQAAVFRRKKIWKTPFKELGEKNVYLYMYVDLEIHLYYLTPVLNLFELFVENLKHPEILISKAPPWRSQFRWQNNWKHAEGCQGFCPDGAVETDFCYVAFLERVCASSFFHGKAVQLYHVCLEIQTRQLFQMGWFRGLVESCRGSYDLFHSIESHVVLVLHTCFFERGLSVTATVIQSECVFFATSFTAHQAHSYCWSRNGVFLVSPVILSFTT